MTAVATSTSTTAPEIEFRLIGGRLGASARFNRDGDASDAGTGTDLDLNHVGSILKSVADGVRQLEAELPRTLATRDAAFRCVARYPRFPLSPLFGWGLPRLRSQLSTAEEELGEAVARWNANWTALRFSFGPATLDSFRDLAIAFQGITSAKATWSVATHLSGSFSNPVSAAELKKQAVRTGPNLPEHVESDWPGLDFRTTNEPGLTVYPGFALVSSGPDVSLVSLLDISLDAREAIVAESGDPPSDAVIARRVWERANKDGSPDRRYANNPSTAIVQYGRLRFSAPGAMTFTYLVSNLHAAKKFAAAFGAFQRRLREEAASGGASVPMDRGTVGIAPIERRLAAVPPPPVVRAAHEYTLAAFAACCIGVWILTTGPVSDRPAVAATSSSVSPPPQVVTQPPPPPDVRADAAVMPPHEAATPDPVDAPVAVVPPVVSQRSTLPERERISNSVLPPPQVVPQPSPPPDVRADAAVMPPPGAATPDPVDVPVAVVPPVVSQRFTPPERERIIIRSGGAYIRSAPNGGAVVVRTASGGSRLNVFGRSNGWVRVGDAEGWGWVHSSLLEGGR
jgi:hypothetical protein